MIHIVDFAIVHIVADTKCFHEESLESNYNQALGRQPGKNWVWGLGRLGAPFLQQSSVLFIPEGPNLHYSMVHIVDFAIAGADFYFSSAE